MLTMTSLLQTLAASALLVSAAAAGQVPMQQQQQQQQQQHKPPQPQQQQQQQQQQQPAYVVPGNLVVIQTDAFEDGKVTETTIKLADGHVGRNPGVDVKVTIPGVTCERDTFSFPANCATTTSFKVKCKPDGCLQKGADGSVVPIAATLAYKMSPANNNNNNNKNPNVTPRPTETQTLQRKQRLCGTCQGEGDPHIKNLDGAKFDFQTPGVFTYFESGPFKVETYQDRCGLRLNLGDRTPSCYKGAAVAFGSAAVVRLFLENGKIVVATDAGNTAYQQWLDVQKLQGNTDGYRVFLKADTATYVDVTAATWQGDAYVNVALQVSPLFRRAGAVKGLMGNWDGVQQREESDPASLAKAWQRDLANNLFTCTGAACGAMVSPVGPSDVEAASVAASKGLLAQGFTPYVVTQQRAFKPVITAIKKLRMRRAQGLSSSDETSGTGPTKQPDVTPRAQQLCRQVITSIPHCAQYVADVSYFVDSYCVGDASLLQDLSVVDSAKLAYLRECRRGLDSRIEANVTAELPTLLQHRGALSFGDLSTCANGCSGAGECLAAGCKCNAGVTGFACDLKI